MGLSIPVQGLFRVRHKRVFVIRADGQSMSVSAPVFNVSRPIPGVKGKLRDPLIFC